jgi:acyl-CoA reductase-like NAD-dependent aldehyde dehydrogenase
MSTDRIIIHAEIAKKFLAALKNALAGMGTAPSPTFVVSAASKARLEALVSDAIAKGGSNLTHDADAAPINSVGAHFAPTVIGDVTGKMEMWRDESFGPLVGYVIAKSEDEAIEIANSTEYGLSASVFTQDLRKGFAVARRLESG